MNATMRVVAEAITRSVIILAGLMLLPQLFYYWIMVLWFVRPTGEYAEWLPLVLLAVGIIFAVFYLLGLWWVEMRIATMFVAAGRKSPSMERLE